MIETNNSRDERNATEQPRRTGYERLDRYRRAETVTVQVRGRHGIGTPWVLEHDGVLFDDSRFNKHKEEFCATLGWIECARIIAQLGGPDASLACAKLAGIADDREKARVLALLREIGEFLVYHQQAAVWKVLYQHLYVDGRLGVHDLLRDRLEVSTYAEHDELRFLWLHNWKQHLASIEEALAENAQLRAALDVQTPWDEENEEPEAAPNDA